MNYCITRKNMSEGSRVHYLVYKSIGCYSWKKNLHAATIFNQGDSKQLLKNFKNDYDYYNLKYIFGLEEVD